MAYAILKLGGVPALPFFCLGEAVRGLAGRNSTVMPADHGPAEAGKDIEAAGQEGGRTERDRETGVSARRNACAGSVPGSDPGGRDEI